MIPCNLEYLKILCWHTQGRYDKMTEKEVLNIYELGFTVRPICFNIQEEEIQYIIELNKRLNGVIHEEQIRAIKT